jgi:hypothetical protein
MQHRFLFKSTTRVLHLPIPPPGQLTACTKYYIQWQWIWNNVKIFSLGLAGFHNEKELSDIFIMWLINESRQGARPGFKPGTVCV